MADPVDRILDDVWPTAPNERETRPFHMPKLIDTEKLPRSLRRAKSALGFLAAWKKLRDAVWVASTIPYKRLPEFAHRWGKALYDTHERRAYDAVLIGDVMFFEAWAARLLMIDHAAEARGLTIQERGTVLYALGVVQGYRDATAKRLKELGGAWPPQR